MNRGRAENIRLQEPEVAGRPHGPPGKPAGHGIGAHECLATPEGNIIRAVEVISSGQDLSHGFSDLIAGLSRQEMKCVVERLIAPADPVCGIEALGRKIMSLPLSKKVDIGTKVFSALADLGLVNDLRADNFINSFDFREMQKARGGARLVAAAARSCPDAVITYVVGGDLDWMKNRRSREHPGLTLFDTIIDTLWKADPEHSWFYLSDEPQLVHRNQHDFDMVLRGVLKSAGIKGALSLLEKRANYLEQSRAGIPHARSIRERLDALGRAIAAVKEEKDLDADFRERLGLATDLIGRGIIVDSQLVDSLTQCEGRTRKFYCRILESCGSAWGRSIVDAASMAFKPGRNLSEYQEKVIQAIVATGFRGVSAEILQAFEARYHESPAMAELMVWRWKRAARAFMSPQSLPPSMKKNPFYTELLTVAYRPNGHHFTIDTLRRCVNGAVDQQKHLKGYVYPAEGWHLDRSVIAGTQKTKKSVNVPDSAVATLNRCLDAFLNPQRPDLLRAGITLLKGGDGQVSPEALAAEILGRYAPEKTEIALRRIQAALTDAEKASIVRQLIEGELEQAFDNCARNLSRKVDLSPKFSDLVKKILKLKEGTEITGKETADALAYRLYSYSREMRRSLAQYARKGDGEEDAVLFLTKCDHSFFSRGAAGICSVTDTWSWNNPDFLQMNLLVPSDGRVYGNVQLHLFTDHRGRKSIMPRININDDFPSGGVIAPYVDWILSAVREFASKNGLVPYLPENEIATHSDDIADRMARYHGKAFDCDLRVLESRAYDVKRVFKMLERPENFDRTEE